MALDTTPGNGEKSGSVARFQEHIDAGVFLDPTGVVEQRATLLRKNRLR